MPSPSGRQKVLDLVLMAEFTTVSALFARDILSQAPGIDARIYQAAGRAWLAGSDPWAADWHGYFFAGAPPTVALYAAFAWVPEDVFAWASIAVCLAAAVAIVRTLRLPVWYILFPPLFEAIPTGNPDALLTFLLVSPSVVPNVLAAILKIYSVVPLVLLGRYRAIRLLLVALVFSAPLLPWADFVRADIAGILARQNAGGHSAFSLPLLIVPTAIALVALGRVRAAWLAVPALWPYSQVHYGALALPALTPAMAAILAVPIPGSAALAVILGAILAGRERQVSVSPAPESPRSRLRA